MILTDGVHLVADTMWELHDFAKRIHLRREWFQPGRHPHYDLTTLRAARRAVVAGAVYTTTRHCARVSAALQCVESDDSGSGRGMS